MVHLYHILIAEDDPSLLTMLMRLTQRCYPTALVRGVENGLLALHAYTQDGADLLITNCCMPLLDGPSLIYCLRECASTIPTIGFSGDPIYATAFRRAGVTAYIDSPFSIADFQRTVYALLSPTDLP